MPPLPARKLALAALLVLAVSAAGLAADAVPPPADAIQMLADITLIDGECRNVAVDFGPAFQVAEAMGLRASDAMPTGAFRPAFEAATRSRFTETSHDDLCGDIAGAYALRVPGVLRLR